MGEGTTGTNTGTGTVNNGIVTQNDRIYEYSIDFYDLDSTTNRIDLETRVNTWQDFHLIPTSRPSVSNPGVNVNLVEIPGRSTPIDMTMFPSKSLVYGIRSGSFDFYVENDHEPWYTIRNKMLLTIHGKRKCIVLQSDPSYYYEGRFLVDDWRSEANFSHVAINYQLNPFATSLAVGRIQLTATSTTSAVASIPAGGYPYPVSVSFYATSGSLSVYQNGRLMATGKTGSTTFMADTSVSSGFENQVALTGRGTVDLVYREVRL